MSRGGFKGAKQSGMAHRMPGCRLPGSAEGMEAFACGDHVAGRIKASLRTHGDVTLVVADTAVALADLLDFERGAYVLDTAAIRHLVDAATTADPRYTPSTIRKHMTRRPGAVTRRG